MSEITLLEVKNAYDYLTYLLAITYELTKVSTNVETTQALINKLESFGTDKREYYATLHASVKECLDHLKDELIGIADTFSDTEGKVFIKWIFEKKTNQEIADELGKTYEYVKHLAANVKKRAEAILNNYVEQDIVNKLLKDIETLKEENNGVKS